MLSQSTVWYRGQREYTSMLLKSFVTLLGNRTDAWKRTKYESRIDLFVFLLCTVSGECFAILFCSFSAFFFFLFCVVANVGNAESPRRLDFDVWRQFVLVTGSHQQSWPSPS